MLYVSDQQRHLVVEFEALTRATTWRESSPSWPAGNLRQPAGIACAPEGRLIVADRGHHRIVVFSPDRAAADVLAPDRDAIGALWQPTGVALGPAGELLIADTGNHRIVRCESLDKPSWSAYGTAGLGEGQFSAPTGVAVDATGRITVADPGAGRVVRLSGMDGADWNEVPLPPSAAQPRPYGIAIKFGGVLIADSGTSRVLLLATDAAGGESVSVLIDGAADGSLIAPVAALEWSDALLVADPAGASIAEFAPPLDGGAWTLLRRLYGQRAPFPSPPFARIGGLMAGGAL